jgi:uncharacterized protein (DUF362 family)
MTRREWLAALGTAAGLSAAEAPTAPVAVARCQSYDEDIDATLGRLFDQIGGLPRLVKNKTVTIKLNLTGSPAVRLRGRLPGFTHYTHPKTAAVMAHLIGRAGARRIRFVEGCYGTAAPLEEFLLESGWNLRTLQSIAPRVEFANTNVLSGAKSYARVRPARALIFPAYDLHPAYVETDVLVSMSRLKEHAVCGITLAMKNIFGITPISVYGDDAGAREPNENPTQGRVSVCHDGKRQPSASAPREIDPASPRDPGYRMPRITAELCAARPIGISFIDGIETVAGGEGPWIQPLRAVRPGLLILGTNPVCTDTVGTALMGFNPRAPRGQAPFRNGDNTLLLAESLGLGTADLKQIEIAGPPLKSLVSRDFGV